MGRGLAPSLPPTQGQLSSGSLAPREGTAPPPCFCPGMGVTESRPPSAATPYTRFSTCGDPILDSPRTRVGSQGTRGFKLTPQARPGTRAEELPLGSPKAAGSGDGGRAEEGDAEGQEGKRVQRRRRR